LNECRLTFATFGDLSPWHAVVSRKSHMESEYYIFKILPDGTPVWIDHAGDIEEAAKTVFTLEQTSPGPYVVYDLKTPNRPCFRIEAVRGESTTIGTAI
jgi:hypothetical protein